MKELINDSEKWLNIPQTLEDIRYEKKLSKQDFARLCGISGSFYSEILHKSKSLNLETLEKMCKGMEVPIEIFIFKALNESFIKDPAKRKLLREIRPLMNKITSILYFTHSDDFGNLVQEWINANKDKVTTIPLEAYQETKKKSEDVGYPKPPPNINEIDDDDYDLYHGKIGGPQSPDN